MGAVQNFLGRVADEHLALGFHAGEVLGHEGLHGLFRAGDNFTHEVLNGIGRYMKTHILAQRGSRIHDEDAGPQTLGKQDRVFGHGLAVLGEVHSAKNLLDFLHGKLHFPCGLLV